MSMHSSGANSFCSDTTFLISLNRTFFAVRSVISPPYNSSFNLPSSSFLNAFLKILNRSFSFTALVSSFRFPDLARSPFDTDYALFATGARGFNLNGSTMLFTGCGAS